MHFMLAKKMIVERPSNGIYIYIYMYVYIYIFAGTLSGLVLRGSQRNRHSLFKNVPIGNPSTQEKRGFASEAVLADPTLRADLRMNMWVCVCSRAPPTVGFLLLDL